jgi:Holliday junction resolvase RusA-like endonuclease
VNGFTTEWLNEYRKKRAAENNPAVQTSIKKQRRPDALDKKAGTPRITSPVYIELHSYRKGWNWDTDNACPKSVVDGLVHAGIIEDDSFKQVKGISSIGHHVETKEEECSIIRIFEA